MAHRLRRRTAVAVAASLLAAGLTVAVPPAAAATTITVMPLGDSVTKGEGDPALEGYRRPLYDTLTGDGYSVDFVGGLMNGTFADPDHEGHEGWRAHIGDGRSIRDNVYGFLDASPADVVLLHIGTNDISDHQPAALVRDEIKGILDNIDSWETDNGRTVWVVLALILNRDEPTDPPLELETTTLNGLLADLAATRISAGDVLTVVDMESALNYPADLFDHVHPTTAGYAKMAAVWVPAVENAIDVLTNQAPTAAGDSYSVLQSATLAEPAPGVLDNDSDPDGDPLAASLVSGPAHGDLTFNGDGSFTYVHDGGPDTADSFQYDVTDGIATSPPATVSISIVELPVAVDDPYGTGEGATLQVAAPGVLGNDTGPGPMTALLTRGPANGNLTLNGDGSFTYTHDGSETVADSFSYEVESMGGFSQEATVTLTITPVNDPPAVDAGSDVATYFGHMVTVTAAFSDPDGGGHSGTLDWGDGQVAAASVNEAGHTASGSHAFGSTGAHTVTVCVIDDLAAEACDTMVVQVPFGDTAGSVHAASIVAIWAAGITRGCNPPANDSYCPDDTVARGQMAAFLVRALGLGPADGDYFTDDDS
ncbi:MAG: Ig-like domain-containing protein, partial [Acidimicrobiia bacterium]